MPNPYDLLSEKLDDQADPDDQLRLQLGQDQGANLAGGPQAVPGAQPVAPSPNVAGPLAAIPAAAKPKVRPKAAPPQAPKPKITLKTRPKIKPKIKLKAPTSPLQNFLSAIGTGG